MTTMSGNALTDLLGIEGDTNNRVDEMWVNMPEFEQNDKRPYKSLTVNFRTKEDYDEFAGLISQQMTPKTKGIWHPKLDVTKNSLLRWVVDDV